jgi:hypothetical protein
MFRWKQLKVTLVSVLMLLLFVPDAALASSRRPVRAQAPPDLTPVYAEKPFVTPKARQKFQDYVARLSLKYNRSIQIPREFWDAAPDMLYWGYEFQQNNMGTIDVTFKQSFDATSLLNAIRSVIAGISYDDCSYFTTSNITMASFSRFSVVFTAVIEGKVRVCEHNPIGSDFKENVGNIGGSATAVFRFHPQATPNGGRYTGQLVADPVQADVSPDVDVFGFNANSVAGQILIVVGKAVTPGMIMSFERGNLTFPLIIDAWNGELWRVPGNDQNNAMFLNLGDGSVESAKYRKFMTDIRSLTWSIQPSFMLNDAQSGLDLSSTPPTLTIAYTATLKPFEPYDTVRADVENEIELIKSFAKDQITANLSRGQNLWDVAKQFYGNGFYFHFLAAANNFRSPSRLPVNQAVIVPPMYALSPLDGYHFMAPGETVEGLCKNWMPTQIGHCIAEVRGKNRSQNLNKLNALDGIRVPDGVSNY